MKEEGEGGRIGKDREGERESRRGKVWEEGKEEGREKGGGRKFWKRS